MGVGPRRTNEWARPRTFEDPFDLGDEIVAKSVDDLCREQAISFDELCRRSELDSSRVQAIYLGRWTPSPAERQAIATALGVDAGQIAWGHKTPIQHIYGHGPT